MSTYTMLGEFAHQNVMCEMGTRPAFHALLAAQGKSVGWTLIAEHEKKVNGGAIRPDGTFKDAMNLVRGYWEAKDRRTIWTGRSRRRGIGGIR